jgi:hypothetical protein
MRWSRTPGLAEFATLGVIFKLLFMEEKLLAGCKHKLAVTVHALQQPVHELHLTVSHCCRIGLDGNSLILVFVRGHCVHLVVRAIWPGIRVSTGKSYQSRVFSPSNCFFEAMGGSPSQSPRILLYICELILLFTDLLAIPFACEGFLYAFLFAWFQVKGVALDLFDNVFRLHFPLETTKSILQRLAFLNTNFCQD